MLKLQKNSRPHPSNNNHAEKGGKETYVVIHERDIEQLRDLRVLAEVVAIVATTLVLQLCGRPDELPDHVELGPVDLRLVLRLPVWVALVRSPEIRRVHFPVRHSGF